MYLRPYPKSYADELFEDSIAIDPKDNAERRVPFRQFIGIVGPLYDRVFEKRRWKGDDGSVMAFVKKDAKLKQRTPLPPAAYLGKEADLGIDLGAVLEKQGLLAKPPEEV